MAKDIFGNPELPNLFGNNKIKDKRINPTESQKKKVFDDQKGKCWKCKKHLKLSSIKFHSRGGKTTTDNLIALHADCHDELHNEERAKSIDKKRKTTNKSNTTNILGLGNKKKGNSLFEIDF